MTSTYSPFTHRERRAALKQQRQRRQLQALWRSLCVSSLTGGLLWGIFLPQWNIRELEQVEIQKNQYLTSETIKNLITEEASQSVITLPPQKIERILQQQAPIEQAKVVRDLYPPRVTIAITERQPVAVTLPNPTAVASLGKGYLDPTGIWMPQDSYRDRDSFASPSLKVIGYRPEYRFQWAQIYQQIKNHPLTIHTINWTNPANLILETELGEVHLGGNLETLPKQLEKLAHLKNLPQKHPPQETESINLQNPDFIVVNTP